MKVFVPSFGDLFLIKMKKYDLVKFTDEFSSPLLGICF